MADLHDLRLGDIVIREMDGDDGVESNVGEVTMICAHVRYLDVDYDWGERPPNEIECLKLHSY